MQEEVDASFCTGSLYISIEKIWYVFAIFLGITKHKVEILQKSQAP